MFAIGLLAAFCTALFPTFPGTEVHAQTSVPTPRPAATATRSAATDSLVTGSTGDRSTLGRPDTSAPRSSRYGIIIANSDYRSEIEDIAFAAENVATMRGVTVVRL